MLHRVLCDTAKMNYEPDHAQNELARHGGDVFSFLPCPNQIQTTWQVDFSQPATPKSILPTWQNSCFPIHHAQHNLTGMAKSLSRINHAQNQYCRPKSSMHSKRKPLTDKKYVRGFLERSRIYD